MKHMHRWEAEQELLSGFVILFDRLLTTHILESNIGIHNTLFYSPTFVMRKGTVISTFLY